MNNASGKTATPAVTASAVHWVSQTWSADVTTYGGLNISRSTQCWRRVFSGDT